MSDANPATPADETIGTSPARIDNADLRFEAQRAFVWIGIAGLFALAIYISQSLLVIFGALVFAAMLDGGSRLLGRILPVARIWRVFIVLGLLGLALYWLATYAGSQLSKEAAQLPEIVTRQYFVTIAWLNQQGVAVDPGMLRDITASLASGMGTVTRMIGGLMGGLTTMFLIIMIGIYVAAEPKLYERGVAWMVVRDRRDEISATATKMAYTMRRLMAGRLLGMAFEGVFTWAMLAVYGVPMAALLGILTGLLAFIPNLGALVAGLLMVMVGFAGGMEMGLYTLFVYVLVQALDGYILIPMIAKKTVDLAPALVLAFQLIMGILFGILGLFLADPALAMLKVALERRAERIDHRRRNKLEVTSLGT